MSGNFKFNDLIKTIADRVKFQAKQIFCGDFTEFSLDGVPNLQPMCAVARTVECPRHTLKLLNNQTEAGKPTAMSTVFPEAKQMSIFGISALHNGDATEDFLRRGMACMGCPGKLNPVCLRPPCAEDIVFIESFTPQSGLKISAIGVITSSGADWNETGCVPVAWVWQGEKLIENPDDVCPLRNGGVYEELNPWIQREIMDLLPERNQLADVYG